jgi:hypothetical protein
MSGTKETIGFEAFSTYSNQNPGAGYGGMDWTSIYTFGKGEQTALGYCDTGYNNALKGGVDAFMAPFSDGYGTFETASAGDNFTLKSMSAACAWNGQEGFTFNSYTYKHGTLHLKASDYIQTYQTGGTINFGSYGKDFKNIAAVTILTGNVFNGHPGSYCTYGVGTYGYQMAFDNIKVSFKNGIPTHSNGHIKALLPIQQLHHQHLAGGAMAHMTHQGAAHTSSGHSDSHTNSHHTSTAYHTQLTSLGHDHGLTSNFHLASVEHFGS